MSQPLDGHDATTARTLAFGLLTVAMLLLFTGCQRELMRAPVMFDHTLADPFSELPESQRKTTARIFYATDRLPPETPNEKLPYGNKRAPALTLGVVDTEIGQGMSWDKLLAHTVGDANGQRPRLFLESPREFGLLLTTAPPRVVRAQSDATGDEEDIRFEARKDPGSGALAFAAAINSEMHQTDHREVYVYVHGYRNSFIDCVESATSLHHYNGRRGAVVAFAWPSQKHLLDYFEDRESATYAVSDLRHLLIFLSEHTDAERINIIAHSMGTFLTSSTLRELRLIGYDQTSEDLQQRFRIDNVVLVAPDIDIDVLQKRFFRDGFHLVGRTMTIYTSPDDKALAWATRLLYGIIRAGSVTGEFLDETQRLWLKSHPHVTVVDITGQKTYGLGHSHHTENPGVASDILLLLAHDLTPAERGLALNPDTSVWGFPEAYTEAVQQIAERYYQPLDERPDDVLPAVPANEEADATPPPHSPSPAGSIAAP